MQSPERPFDGEASGDGAPSYEWLDEWLCEYVDGTMDPSVEAVFEQYVEANPELKAHVERLRQTRELLCGCKKAESPSPKTAVEVKREVDGELLRGSAPELFSEQGANRSVVALGLASSIAVALVVGFLAGSMLVDPATLSSVPATAVERQAAPSEAVRADADPQPRATAPARESRRSSVSADEVFLTFPTDTPAPNSDTGRTASTFMTAGGR